MPGAHSARPAPEREIAVRTFVMSLSVLAALSSTAFTARAAQSDACKQCAEQQRACAANYSGKTCKSEYDICMKGCRSK